MQIILAVTGSFTLITLGFALCVLSNPYSRRCWAIWLMTTASAMEERRSAHQEIEEGRRKRENEMRTSYGIDPIGPFRKEPSRELAKRP